MTAATEKNSRSFQMQLAFRHITFGRLRGTARYAVAVVLVAAWSGISTAAQAQSDPSRQLNGQGPMPAPIGHRQPRAQDLPPDVLRDEGMTPRPPESASKVPPGAPRDQGAGQTTFGDNQQQICRGC
jgi:hypothetical protein